MQRTHKIRLKPNQTQTVALYQAAGTARYVYNWALATWKQQYEDFKDGKAEKPDVYSICRRWTKEKPDWARGIACCLQTRAILNLGRAMINFWNKTAAMPTFKKKNDRDSFYIPNDRGGIKGNRIHLTGIGKIRLCEGVRFRGSHLGYVVSRRADQWFVSVHVELDDPIVANPSSSVVGVDVGIKNIAVASDGTVLENPRYLDREQRRLKHYRRQLSRQVKGSNRHKRNKFRIARIHQRIVNQRSDVVHKFTSQLSKNHGVAVIETLDVKAMIAQGRPWMNRCLQDTCMTEVHRQLGYKMRVLEKAPAFYQSSKMCSSCGHVKTSMPLELRVYSCKCGLEIDRDLNAALNLMQRRWVTASSCVETPKGSMKRKAKTGSRR